MADRKNDIEKVRVKARLSFLIEIEADDKETYDEAVEDLKFHFKNSRTSTVSIFDGKSFGWRIVKQRKEDIIVKKIKEIK